MRLQFILNGFKKIKSFLVIKTDRLSLKGKFHQIYGIQLFQLIKFEDSHLG